MNKGSGIFLVMDDEEIMREILTDMLKSFGYEVGCTDYGFTASISKPFKRAELIEMLERHI